MFFKKKPVIQPNSYGYQISEAIFLELSKYLKNKELKPGTTEKNNNDVTPYDIKKFLASRGINTDVIISESGAVSFPSIVSCYKKAEKNVYALDEVRYCIKNHIPLYLALHTDVPSIDNQNFFEINYSGYSRQHIVFKEIGDGFLSNNEIYFSKYCGKFESLTHFSVSRCKKGDCGILLAGSFTHQINLYPGIILSVSGSSIHIKTMNLND